MVAVVLLHPWSGDKQPTTIKTVTEPPKIVTVTKIERQDHYIAVNTDKPIEMTVTAYDNSFQSTGKHPGDKGYGITYTGTKAHWGVCAVDRHVFPLGTSFYIQNYGYCVAADIGSGIKGYHIDVWMKSRKKALEWGNRKRKVWLLNGFK